MIKTIKDLIEEQRPFLNAEREIRMEDNLEDVYGRIPRLKDIDCEIVAIRRDILIASLEDDKVRESFLENSLRDKKIEREKIILDNSVDPLFDSPKPICTKCNDNGFVESKNGYPILCDCKNELFDIVCNKYAGLALFPLYKNEGFKSNMFGNKDRRIELVRRIIKVINGEDDQHKLMLYSDKAGTGKTYLAVCMTKNAISYGKSAYYLSATDMDDIDNELLDFIKSCDFLSIDNMYTIEGGRPKDINILNSILEARIAKGLTTLIISHCSFKVLCSESDVRIGSKLKKAWVI